MCGICQFSMLYLQIALVVSLNDGMFSYTVPQLPGSAAHVICSRSVLLFLAPCERLKERLIFLLKYA